MKSCINMENKDSESAKANETERSMKNLLKTLKA